MRGSMMARLILLGGVCLFTMGSQYRCSSGDGTLDVGDDDETFSTTLILRDIDGASSTRFRLGDPIRFDLTIVNNTSIAQEIDLPTGQIYDFVVLNPGTQTTRWRWATDRSFTQAFITVEFAPNQSRSYSFVWSGVLDNATLIMPGNYEARGMLAFSRYSADWRAPDEFSSPLKAFTVVN